MEISYPFCLARILLRGVICFRVAPPAAVQRASVAGISCGAASAGYLGPEPCTLSGSDLGTFRPCG